MMLLMNLRRISGLRWSESRWSESRWSEPRSSKPRRFGRRWLQFLRMRVLALLMSVIGVTALAVPMAARAADCPAGDECNSNEPQKELVCPRGTRKQAGACLELVVPEFASLTRKGDDFECWRGYVLQGGACARIEVPEHADLDESGHAWRCRRGFVQTGDRCDVLQVPENASLDTSGNGWTCWRGYQRSGSACERVRVPPYASLNEAGNGWECWAGYRAEQDECIRLPMDKYVEALADERGSVERPQGLRGPDAATDAPSAAGDGSAADSPRGSVRSAGLCGGEYVVGTLEISGNIARGRLGGESGQSFLFEGRVDAERVEGEDESGRSCTLIRKAR